MARRDYGTGSVFQRARDGKWVASVAAGWTRSGARRRRTRITDTEAKAKAALRSMLREAKAHEAPSAGGRPTVKTWADQWLETQSHELRPTSWQATKSQVSTWIIPTIGHKRLDSLTPADRRSVIRAMSHHGLAQGSLNRANAVLAKMLKDALLDGHAIPSAVLAVSGSKRTESDREDIPLPDALEILAAAADLPDGSRWVAALLQGMRPAECRGLTWGAIDFDSETVDVSWQMKALPYRVARDRSSGFRLPDGYMARPVDGALHLVRPKTQKGRRVIPLVPWMTESLRTWREIAPKSSAHLVWPQADGAPRRDDGDRADWVALCDTAQVARVDGTEGRRYALYEARHTTATLLREAGVDDETIKAIMGHATILSTKAYLHTDDARTRAALEKVAKRLALS